MTDRKPLELKISWDSPDKVREANSLAWGSGVLLVCGVAYWGKDWSEGRFSRKGFHWNWCELLQFLSEHYEHILFRRVDWSCFPHRPKNTSKAPLKAQGDRRQHWFQPLMKELEFHLSDEFNRGVGGLSDIECRQNLAAAFQGAYPAPLWLLAEGRYAWILAEHDTYLLPLTQVQACLDEIGNTIADRLRDSTNPTDQETLRRWEDRLKPTPEHLAVLTGGASTDLGETDPARWGLNGATLHDSPLAMAAREARSLTPDERRSLLEAMRNTPAAPTPVLDKLRHKARNFLDQLHHSRVFQSYDKGYSLASWYREQRSLSDTCDVRQELEALGIAVQDITFRQEKPVAIGYWGTEVGPAILLNSSAHREDINPSRRRVSLAHELAHFLTDLDPQSAFVDVLGGEFSAPAEQMAKAFAAELLAPRDLVFDLFSQFKTTKAGLQNVMKTFEVGKEVAAWQIRNSEGFDRLSLSVQSAILRAAKA